LNRGEQDAAKPQPNCVGNHGSNEAALPQPSSRLAVGWSGGFLTTDFTDIKDFTDGEKLTARKILQGKQEADR
jgi:hypothetical protein